MDKFKSIQQSALMNPTLRKFINSANKDIERINLLVGAYNKKKDKTDKNEQAKANELLLQIHAFHKRILEKYQPDHMAQVPEFQTIVQEQMFQAIQKEFKERNLDSMSRSSILGFDLSSVTADSKPKEQRTIEAKFELLLNNDDGAATFFLGKKERDYKDNIRNFIAKMAKEDNPATLYKQLTQLKGQVRQILAENTKLVKSEQKALRSLVRAINSKLNVIGQKHPDVIDNITVAPKSFADFIANMSPEKVAQLSLILTEPHTVTSKLPNLFRPQEEGYTQFQQLLKDHSIEFLGGLNSKNFKVTNLLTNQELVLKLENRLSAPKAIEAYLAADALSDVVTPSYVERYTSFLDSTEGQVSRCLLMTDFCQGGDLESHAKKQIDIHERTKSAMNIYSQMADILEAIRVADAAFPDGKNTNWLMDREGRVRIADGKSFIPAKEGIIDLNSERHTWYNYINTDHMNPREVRRVENPFSVGAIHSYTLGKNLYQYLSGCTNNYLEGKDDGNYYDFSAPVFQTPEGQDLAALIKGLILPRPVDRMPVSEAIKEFGLIQEKIKEQEAAFPQEKLACDKLVEKIRRIDPQCLELPTLEQEVNEATHYHEVITLKGTLEKQVRSSQDKLDTLLHECRESIKSIRNFPQTAQEVDRFETELSSIGDCVSAGVFKASLQEHLKSLKDKAEVQSKIDFKNETFPLVDDSKRDITNQAMEKEHLKAQCNQLVAKCRIGQNDELMDTYHRELSREIDGASDLTALEKIKSRMERELKVDDNSQVKTFKKIIEDYREGAKEWFSINKDVKANRIEQALLDVPVHLREKIFSKDPADANHPALMEVRAALASHRYFGKRNEVYYVKNNVGENTDIDYAKAATTYKNLKDKFIGLREPTVTEDVSETHKPTTGKP